MRARDVTGKEQRVQCDVTPCCCLLAHVTRLQGRPVHSDVRSLRFSFELRFFLPGFSGRLAHLPCRAASCKLSVSSSHFFPRLLWRTARGPFIYVPLRRRRHGLSSGPCEYGANKASLISSSCSRAPEVSLRSLLKALLLSSPGRKNTGRLALLPTDVILQRFGPAAIVWRRLLLLLLLKSSAASQLIAGPVRHGWAAVCGGAAAAQIEIACRPAGREEGRELEAQLFCISFSFSSPPLLFPSFRSACLPVCV